MHSNMNINFTADLCFVSLLSTHIVHYGDIHTVSLKHLILELG